MFPLLLAADIGNYIGLAILVLTVLGWIVNAIKGNDPEGKPLPQRQRQQPKRDLRSEIEVFLEELQKPNQGNQERQQPPERTPQKPAPQPARALADKPRGPKPAKSKPAKTQPSRSSSAKPPAPKVGEGLREHVTQYMAENRIGAEVEQYLAHRIDQSVQQDLSGGTVAPVEMLGPKKVEPHPLLALLSRPEGMRQAILMNEILQRPKSLRSRSHTSS